MEAEIMEQVTTIKERLGRLASFGALSKSIKADADDAVNAALCRLKRINRQLADKQHRAEERALADVGALV